MRFNKKSRGSPKKAVILLSLSLLLVLGLTIHLNYNDSDAVYTIQQQDVEKVALYYNIDNPDVIYTSDEEGNFVEVEIDG